MKLLTLLFALTIALSPIPTHSQVGNSYAPKIEALVARYGTVYPNSHMAMYVDPDEPIVWMVIWWDNKVITTVFCDGRYVYQSANGKVLLFIGGWWELRLGQFDAP